MFATFDLRKHSTAMVRVMSGQWPPFDLSFFVFRRKLYRLVRRELAVPARLGGFSTLLKRGLCACYSASFSSVALLMGTTSLVCGCSKVDAVPLQSGSRLTVNGCTYNVDPAQMISSARVLAPQSSVTYRLDGVCRSSRKISFNLRLLYMSDDQLLTAYKAYTRCTKSGSVLIEARRSFPKTMLGQALLRCYL